MFQNLNTFEMINSAWKGFPDYTVVLLPLPESSQLVGPSSQPEVEPRPLVVKALTPNHWTCREFPNYCFHKQWRRALSEESINTTFNFCIKMVFSGFLQSCRAWGWVKGGKERERG